MRKRIRPSDEVVQQNIKEWHIPQPEHEYTVLIHCTTYNHGKYIKDALDGFVNQKCSYPFCAIIIDDCSTDNAPDIIREYAGKYPDIIKPILLGENHMQHGILRDPYFEKWHNSAKYIAFCEGDDYWIDALKLQKQVSFLENNPEYGMVYGKARFWKDGKVFGSHGTADCSFEGLLTYSNFPTLTRVFRKTIENRYFDEVAPRSMPWMMGDYPQAFYYVLNSKIKFFDEYFAVYRLLDSSASHSKDVEYLFKFYDSADDVRRYFVNNYVAENDKKQMYLHLIKEREIEYKISLLLNCNKINEARTLYVQNNDALCTYNRVKFYLSTKSLLLYKVIIYIQKIVSYSIIIRNRIFQKSLVC